MKKIISLLLFCIIFTGCTKKGTTTFYLEDKYYNTISYITSNSEEVNELIENKSSFVLFVYQDLCVNSYNFEKVLNEFVNENQIGIVKIAYSDIENTLLADTIKYYPSFVIFKEGKIVDYLDANSDEDTKYFKNIDDFSDWFKSYIKIKETKKIDNEVKEDNNSTKKEFNIDNIKYDSEKVNIYFFYGDGCPHCKKEHEFFDSIEETYGKYYKLNDFEVMNNKDNADLLKEFAFRMGYEVKGVPFTIIGTKVFVGFNDDIRSQMISAITSEHKNSYDVYFSNK